MATNTRVPEGDGTVVWTLTKNCAKCNCVTKLKTRKKTKKNTYFLSTKFYRNFHKRSPSVVKCRNTTVSSSVSLTAFRVWCFKTYILYVIQLWTSEIQAFPRFNFYMRKSVTVDRWQWILCFKANIQLCVRTLNFTDLNLRPLITLLFCVTELWIITCLFSGQRFLYLSVPKIFSF